MPIAHSPSDCKILLERKSKISRVGLKLSLTDVMDAARKKFVGVVTFRGCIKIGRFFLQFYAFLKVKHSFGG